MFYDVTFLEISPHGFSERQICLNAKKQGSPQSWMVVLPSDISELLRMPGAVSIQKVDFRCMRCVSYFFGWGEFWKEVLFLVWFDMNQVAWTPQTLGKHLLKSNMEVTNIPSRSWKELLKCTSLPRPPSFCGIRVQFPSCNSKWESFPYAHCSILQLWFWVVGFGYLNTEPNKVFGALLGCPWKLATS